ncbi:valine--pyruvate transaminase [Umezakia ovalisporum]|jgi:valine--pyruvate aminotransferase|uniref:Valine--pyruvate transaminase n=2 Tax=Umezakia ovalisporum TaxID=75695 RepID=A0AA43KFU8_9CYAN|nr:valine--pyruvate transaminase [Umezakia ovalisporum]MBI1242756.1 valine--pyruvate transaminase [Nostoc sp. RI_552]MDH6057073.1 valine--pyruvate transaminase [Umezakia ovalisporum FSS-43]MDH6065022.1 valine--pyruvate transaminase [Umezakia ovalisporum FSS-62]MDH6067196.1 valine--pyruvate transaminase [Umezakia ovalisporum APH033B]MDH6071387.1 valine--pyruvate transaminase [Umezakia ovalisporum CobakiLakeA]
MNPALTQIGAQMSNLTGVRAIMKDIIETLQAGVGQEFMNLSAGNPLILPEVEQLWRHCTAELLASSEYGEVVCRYGSSQGYAPLIEALANDFNKRYGLNLKSSNILITPGSQSLYFYAANAFGGFTNNGELKEIVLPLSPDYTGYGGVCLVPQALKAYKPTLDIDAAAHRFKYRPDFSQLSITESTGCVIFSRPCNPTGNVLSDDEVRKIAALATPYNVPVLIDSAYAPPFPALNFTEMTPVFGENILHCMSLSKVGLPGERIGVAIGDESMIQVLECFQTNLCIHPSRYGQAIAAIAINSGALAHIAAEVIRPFYQQKFAVLENTLDAAMPKDLPWFLHRGEGAIFAWLWLQDLPITDWELYQKLKQVGVIVVPGSTFFPGLREEWHHKHQCLRISLTGTDEEIVKGMKRLAQVTEQVYQQAIVTA